MLDAKALEAAYQVISSAHPDQSDMPRSVAEDAITAYLSALLPADVAELVERLQAGCQRTGEGDNGEELYDVEGASDDMWEAATTLSALSARLERAEGVMEPNGIECHGLDTPERVCFYEQDFYVLSNFSSFEVEWASRGHFKTSEHLYHWLRFATGAANGKLGGAQPTEAALMVAKAVREARSAHDAFKIAQENKTLQRADWNDVKVEKMRMIIRAKAEQHEYVRRKLLATGDRELVENSWRDDFWGWGSNRDGKNMLGKLWMEVRAELRAASGGPANV
ncbi:NADAR family protein [Mesorhizobium retamae]|uniref:NADAR family protein n=1 Tax=Mesorhizobium retamae TaxID=2912854 RepID=A0ABS9QKI5_9HYPH|nr:NADAR family protein [Mesorhizobium sp. IRAMC:0171]MCG7507104.1 NADAR family protein [Mesorhizobium sp. IRAMC:0171]